MSKRRGSRLFSGQPGLLLVSEDIPGITMPAPPPKDAPPLEDDELEFDLATFHAQEDEDELGHEGPLRVFLGADNNDALVDEDDESPVFDVSALAMPAGPDDVDTEDETALEFLSDGDPVDEDDVVDLGSPPPALSMGTVSSNLSMDDAGEWDENPTQPMKTMPSTAVIRDTPPANLPPATVPAAADMDPLDIPEPDSFLVDESVTVTDGAPGQTGLPSDVIWDDDDTAFFEDASEATPQRTIPTAPPRPKVDTQGESRTFRAIPDKEDPSILPLLLILIGIVIMAVAFSLRYAGGETAPAIEPAQNPVVVTPSNTPAPRTESSGQVSEVVRNVGFLSIDSDKAANIYVDDRKVGITPVIKAEVVPGRHRVLAVEVETGKRKAATADVQPGEERRVRFAFQPVQQ